LSNYFDLLFKYSLCHVSDVWLANLRFLYSGKPHSSIVAQSVLACLVTAASAAAAAAACEALSRVEQQLQSLNVAVQLENECFVSACTSRSRANSAAVQTSDLHAGHPASPHYNHLQNATVYCIVRSAAAAAAFIHESSRRYNVLHRFISVSHALVQQKIC